MPADPAIISTGVVLLLGADGANGQILTTDGAGNLSWAADAGGISNVVEDTTPQLGGNLDANGNTIDGRNVATDGTKLDGIEAAADVTDEANVTSALDGATLTGVTVATGDKVLVQDADDSNNLKTVTTQSIADLGGGGTVQGTDGTYDIQATNEGATAGNARGENSVDLQTERSAATQVASGANSVICGGATNTASGGSTFVGGGTINRATNTYSTVAGGRSNTCSGTFSFIGGGSGNQASGAFSVAGGRSGQASGDNSTVGGGYHNIASGDYSFVGGGGSAFGMGNKATGEGSVIVGGGTGWAGNFSSATLSFVGGGKSNRVNVGRSYGIIVGGLSNEIKTAGTHGFIGGGASNDVTASYGVVVGGLQGVADKFGQHAHSGGRFTSDGDAQGSHFVLRKAVTHSSAAWTALNTDGSTAQLTLAADTAWAFNILLVGATAGMTKSFGFRIEGLIENDGGTTTIKASTVTTIDDADDTDFDARVTADNTNDALLIEVSDSTSGGDAVRWVAHVDTAEITFA